MYVSGMIYDKATVLYCVYQKGVILYRHVAIKIYTYVYSTIHKNMMKLYLKCWYCMSELNITWIKCNIGKKSLPNKIKHEIKFASANIFYRIKLFISVLQHSFESNRWDKELVCTLRKFNFYFSVRFRHSGDKIRVSVPYSFISRLGQIPLGK